MNRLWIYNLLKKQKQSVVVDSKQSSLIDVVSGVPQGAVLAWNVHFKMATVWAVDCSYVNTTQEATH